MKWKVKKELNIISNKIVDLKGLDNLIGVGYFYCGSNPKLKSISLPNLEYVYGVFSCRENFSLVSISLPKLQVCKDELYCGANPLLQSLSIPVLRSLGCFYVKGNGIKYTEKEVRKMIASVGMVIV